MVYRGTTVVFFWALIGVGGFLPSAADGQQPAADTTADFTQWLQKKSYERFDYEKDGELKTHQMIQFGELSQRETGCVLPVRTISFEVDERSYVKGDVELSLFIECSNPHLVANILTFVGGSDRQHLEARVIGDGLAYPEAPRDGMSLPDLHYTAKLKNGFLAFLGTKVTVLVTARDVSAPPSESGDGDQPRTYEIFSDIVMKAFVVGLRMKKVEFSSRLVIDPIRGPVEEFLEHDDGMRTEIRAVAPPEDLPSGQRRGLL